MEWRKNLYQFEEQPPEQSWDLISKELDDDVPSLRSKLYDISSTPPETVWEAVAAELVPEIKQPTQAPVIWYKRSWNIAAAAVFAVVIFGVIYTNLNKLPVGISTAVINPLPAPNSTEITQQPAEPIVLSAIDLPAEQASLKDNNYIYFTSVNGETKRLSYKLKTLLPALKNKKQHATLDQWYNTLEKSALVPSGNNFFDIVEMVKLVEQNQK